MYESDLQGLYIYTYIYIYGEHMGPSPKNLRDPDTIPERQTFRIRPSATWRNTQGALASENLGFPS